ncbi:hypothetical protein ACLTEW_07390 [Gordonia lacunae]|uniref:hypothetical protein n=1 Tax=Gordonia lacunae TaxID=417102 RepID=UPI0039E59408
MVPFDVTPPISDEPAPKSNPTMARVPLPEGVPDGVALVPLPSVPPVTELTPT